ncbi:MAG: TIM-barrel domain-containing protein, partial [Pseudomonadota bacterium]
MPKPLPRIHAMASAGLASTGFASAMIALAVLLHPAMASAAFGEYESYRHDGARVTIATSIGTLTISAIDDAAFEIHYQENEVRQLPSFARSRPDASVPVDVVEHDSFLTVTVNDLSAVVAKSPVRIDYLYRGGPLMAEESGYFAYDTVRGFRFALDDDEKILGGGERVLGMDRRGQRMPLYNKAHYGYETASSQMYYSLPGVMSSDRYVVVFDNSASGFLDIGHFESDVLQFEAVGGRTAYLVIAGDTYPELIRNYTDVTGRQPLPPRWILGNFASRYGYKNEAEVRDVADRFADADIPLDAVVLDLFWFGPDEKGHMGNLDWNLADFPNGPDLIRDLADDDIRTLLITEPFVLTTSAQWEHAIAAGALAKNAAGQAKRFQFYFGETGLIDIFNDAGRDWFWQAYRRLFEQGAAGTWGDLGEPEVHPGDSLHTLSDHGLVATGDEIHNVYGHEWARLVYERQRQEFPSMRPAILMRSGFAGSQRYGIIPWTGDV